MKTVTYNLRLNGFTLMSGEADETTYRAMIDAFLDDGFTIEGMEDSEMREAVREKSGPLDLGLDDFVPACLRTDATPEAPGATACEHTLS